MASRFNLSQQQPETLILPLLFQKYPGFGKSEAFYSLALTAFSSGSIIAAPVIGFITLCVPYFFILLSATLVHTASNLMYGLATQGWMVLLSYFLLGLSFKAFKVVTLSYAGSKESDYINAYIEHKRINLKAEVQGKEYEHTNHPIQAKDVKIKKTVFIFMGVSIYLPAIVGPGKTKYLHLLCLPQYITL